MPACRIRLRHISFPSFNRMHINSWMKMFLPPIYHTSYSYTIFFTLKQYLNYTNCNIEKLKLVTERLIPSYHHHPQKSEASKSVCSQTNFSLFFFFCLGTNVSLASSQIFINYIPHHLYWDKPLSPDCLFIWIWTDKK